MSILSIKNQVVSPLDALWSLFKSQPKAVRNAFTQRLLQEEVDAEAMRERLVVKESLTKAFKEFREAEEAAVELHYIPEFERRAKILAKKYKSFQKDYHDFLDSLEETPYQGVSLGGGVYKTRMQITSKGKGKSGGARVLNYVVKKVEPHKVSITFLSIFDKNEMETFLMLT